MTSGLDGGAEHINDWDIVIGFASLLGFMRRLPPAPRLITQTEEKCKTPASNNN